VTGCSTTGKGGGILADAATSTASGNVVSGCFAGISGGGISSAGAVTGNLISGCYAPASPATNSSDATNKKWNNTTVLN
jgi:hypothetical protein